MGRDERRKRGREGGRRVRDRKETEDIGPTIAGGGGEDERR